MPLRMTTCLGILLLILALVPIDAAAATPVQLTNDPANQGRPDVGGGMVVWKSLQAGNWDIYRYDIDSGTTTLVTDNPAYQNLPVTNGFVVVWQDNRGGDNDIYMKDVLPGFEQVLVSGPGNQGIPDISGDYVAYVDDSSGSNDVYVIDLATREVIPVATGPAHQWQPRISGHRVVWQDDRSGKWDIYMYDLRTHQETPVAVGPGNHTVGDIDGDRVVWEENSDGQYDIYTKNLADGSVRALTDDAAFQGSPRISGDLVVWEDFRNDPDPNDTYYDYDIYMYDLTAGVESPLASGPSIQARPAVDGETVVWEDTAAGNYDVWMTTVPDTTPPAVTNRSPADGTVTCVSPPISAALADNRTGIDLQSLVLTLDGEDVTGAATITESSVEYQPGALDPGSHTVSITVNDAAGNTTTSEWSFTTADPQPVIAGTRVYWASLEDYNAGLLTVDFEIAEAADAAAADELYIAASPASAGVIAVGLPTPPVPLAAGQSVTVPVKYLIPPGATSFKTTVYIVCGDACGGTHYFPGPPPGA